MLACVVAAADVRASVFLAAMGETVEKSCDCDTWAEIVAATRIMVHQGPGTKIVRWDATFLRLWLIESLESAPWGLLFDARRKKGQVDFCGAAEGLTTAEKNLQKLAQNVLGGCLALRLG